MRYLLLIVACSVMGLAADNPEIMKIYKEMEVKKAAVEAEAVIKYIEYKKREFARMEVPELSKDPKKSEVERHEVASWNNRFIEHFDNAANAIGAYGKAGALFEILRNSDNLKIRMDKLGVKPVAQALEATTPGESAPNPKPKEKKKITAVLADGTKIE